MKGGRKTVTIQVPQMPPWAGLTGNQSVSAKNLGKANLGGVIFGCTHVTMAECLAKQLFGLPSGHMPYVKNVEPGLPLFLFNYSDRKLHGIYEAASHGKLNIDPYAWTIDGTERTSYPSQVRICIKTQCQPLLETEFKKIIADNYYQMQHFWFELDHAQTRGLLSLFKPSKVNRFLPYIPSGRQNVPTDFPPTNPWKNCSDYTNKASKLDVNNVNENKFSALVCEDIETDACSSKTSSDALEETQNRVTWHNSKKAGISDPSKSSQLYVNSLDERFATSGWDDTETDVASPSEMRPYALETQSREVVSNWEDWADEFAPIRLDQVNSHLNLEDQKSLGNQNVAEESVSDVDQVLRKLQRLQVLRSTDQKSVPISNSNGNTKEVALAVCESTIEEHEYDIHYNYSSNIKEDAREIFKYVEKHENEIHPLNESVGSPEETLVQLNDGDPQLAHVMKEMIKLAANLQQSQIQSQREIRVLKDHVRESVQEIAHLNRRIKELEAKVDPSIGLLDVSMIRCVEEYLGSEDVIYIIGGYDGSSWLSSLESFSPSLDVSTQLRSMSSARSYASAAALDGNIYVFGGGDGAVWYNTVECYHRCRDEWVPCPKLLREKGSLAGATLNGKIFAIGGGNGFDCFSDVEMFDSALGKWIFSPSMNKKRFATAAVEHRGSLYVVGGYDGKHYLKSTERLDPRETHWRVLEDMKTRRGCHSLAVFNEKLYAIGGYDDSHMVSTVECYDPRMCSWVESESMNFVRGYAGAIVLGDTLFVIGGVKDGETIDDTVECYKEGAGWTTCNFKSFGKRCFFSAIVL